MDKTRIMQLCRQIAAAADNITSVGIEATATNAPQLIGIRQAVSQIVAEVNKEEKEVAKDG